MTRETLPYRRGCIGFDLEHDGQKYTVHAGFYADGRIAEIFVSGTKIGTAVDTGAREASTIASIAIQYGAAVERLRKSLPRDPQGRALGPVGAALDMLEFA